MMLTNKLNTSQTKTLNFHTRTYTHPHLCYHENHKVLLIDLVLFESRVIAEDFT